LEASIEGATGIMYNVVGGTSLTLFEVNQAAQVIKQMAHPDANIIFGVIQDPSMENDVRITLIATGYLANGLLNNTQAAEQNKLLKAIKTEDEMDVPSFMRHPMFSHRRQIPDVTVRQAAPSRNEVRR
jgi:cell division protein FtsZ